MKRVLAGAVAIALVIGASSVTVVSAHGGGGPWAKTIVGNDKPNKQSGGTKNDLIRGLGGADDQRGGKGKDRLIAGNGADESRGGDGHDDIFGGKGPDLLIGGNGNDIIKGGPGKDTLKGGNGNDTLEAAGDGADFVNCGAGTGDKATVDPSDTVTQCETITVIVS